MARSTPRHESPQRLAKMNDQAVHPRVASSASLHANSATNSDNEGGEKPVREKLKATTIDGQPEDTGSPEYDMGDAEDDAPPAGEKKTGTDDAHSGSDSDRGRLRRKRSFDDIDGDQGPDKTPEKPERHTRKKSRDIKTGEMEQYRKSSGESSVSKIDEQDGDEPMKSTESRPTTPSDTASKVESMISPKNKRSREEYQDSEKGVPEPEKLSSSVVQTGESKTDVAEERQSKRHRDSNSPRSSTEDEKPKQVKIPLGSGFANFSTTSPFASIGGKTQSGFGSFGAKDGENATPEGSKSPASASAFQKSGLSSFASASSPFASLSNTGSASPFGAAATAIKPSIGFGTPAKSPTSSESGFAALASSGKSVFGGDTPSAFGGGLGGGFSGGFGGGFGGFSKPIGSSFAAPGTSGITGLSDKPAKPFGAQEDEDEDSESGDDDDQEDADSKPYHMEEGGRDKRFFAQEVSTGEENEETIFSSRAKIFGFSSTGEGKERGWKERGQGDLKLNVLKEGLSSDDSDDGPKKRPRLVMRADGSKRLILNWLLKKDLKLGTGTGEKPTDGRVLLFAQFVGSEKLESITLKIKPEKAQELWHLVTDLQNDM